ncbi:beta-ketoacyl synthase chain length factor [Chitinimonas lacunae]|uniref:Beta-ketoacyl synthase chain length factor n=1 Tax=Chitinimonas lacunae TaxID=1963018 RepID=A0ABV8MSX9_9NEIS
MESPSAWRDWFASPSPLPVQGTPALAEMPAMMRRRVERLGRIALQATYWSVADAEPGPLVFASRYGDIARSIELLEQLAQGQSLSPTSFSLSVHNAIGALYSIACGDTGPYTAIAAGEETVAAAFVEAQGLLADGAPAVTVICYEEPLPPLYQGFAGNEVNFPRGWACRLRLAGQGGVSVECGTAAADAAALRLPADLAILDFLLSDQAELRHQVGTRQWRWQRHA